ncbi:unnamed protein product [Larinioides sclopetarius]|uniref:Uncharacterized protein n=1 Tax=Larinioides sclopetarius TaxID=280406 RepID=A0AAV1Z508_9ARAC
MAECYSPREHAFYEKFQGMESNITFDESLDYEYDKENENTPDVPENKQCKEELNKVKHNKEAVKTLLQTMNNLKLAHEKLKEELYLKALSRRSYIYTPVHRPARSYTRNRQHSSPYSWSAKKI